MSRKKVRYPKWSPGKSGRSKAPCLTLSVKVLPTNEVFPLPNVPSDRKIKEVRASLEYTTGIPYHMQKLRYLDQDGMLDSQDLRSYHVVPGAQLNLDVWNMWSGLVEAAALGNMDQVFRLGVTEDTSFSTPNSQLMSPARRRAWIADRAFAALFIAVHRGHQSLVNKLLDAGAEINRTTKLGRTPLHAAASQGHRSIVDILLSHGSNIDAVDEFGDTAIAAANKFNHKVCARQIFLFSWQQRAKGLKPSKERELFAHQYFDSAFPVWLNGDRAQIYFSNILPPQEFEGTRIDAPKRRFASRQDRANQRAAVRERGEDMHYETIEEIH